LEGVYVKKTRRRSALGTRTDRRDGGTERVYSRAHRAPLRLKLGGCAFVALSQCPVKFTSVTVPPFGIRSRLRIATLTPRWNTSLLRACRTVCPFANRSEEHTSELQ